MEHLFDMRPERPGYRLQRLEVLNWGTFDSTDGNVYRLEPEGRTALLVGTNGSGKSTLVDAILTLLVPSNIRNYNVAAGAKSTERSERSYIRGIFGKNSDDTQTSVLKCLRPKNGQLSAIAAVFADEQLHRAFTICQVLHLAAEGTADKVFAIVDEARELAQELSGIRSSDAIRGHLQQRGFETTKKFIEYQSWIAKRSHMRGKAMDMFNQTVAVKDIRSLNDFIRQHMLEAPNWRDNVQSLLTHFDDLSVAHQELVRAQKAEVLLSPVEKIGNKYREQSAELEKAEHLFSAAEAFFPSESVRLYEPEIRKSEQELAATIEHKARLGDELKAVAETIRRLKNDLELAGGQRLRDLPPLIKLEQALLNSKHEASARYHEQLRRAGVQDVISTQGSFAAVRERIASLSNDIAARAISTASEHEALLADRGSLRQQLRIEESERQFLSQRQSNLPSHLATLRGRMCEDLQLSESTLPFAAELISVALEERRWEPSAEMVLHSFALSLLVPERWYQRVRAYVEKTKLTDGRGDGQRLVYLRIGKAEAAALAGDRLHSQSLFRKLCFRTGHDLTPWVRDQVLRRFDFRCCESIEEFNDATRLAMTENRHIKVGEDRHEKDDRPRAVDPRHYVLGWDNREKLRRIDTRIDELQHALVHLETRVGTQSTTLDTLRRQQDAIAAVLEVLGFDAIDAASHQTKIANLEQEKRDLETSNKAVRTLRERVLEAEKSESTLCERRDEMVRQEQALNGKIATGVLLVANSRRAIEAAKKAGSYDLQFAQFEAIRQSMGAPSLSVENLMERQISWTRETQRQVESFRKTIQPLVGRLLEVMTRFLREFKEEQSDLDASVDTLESFLGLLDHIRREDLPRHEKKFKERLNDKVTQEVAFFHIELRKECKQIEGKIEQLNQALSQLTYNAGTFMRLEPREVNDREIADFRRSLSECLDESLENTPEANEARFLRIEKLVERLANKDNTTWRDKVIDVRRWYDFSAREIEKESQQTRSYYEDSSGQSGGEKAKLAFTILVAAIAYQYDVDPSGKTPGRFHFVVVDEMFSKVDDQNAEYALKLFEQFGLQLLIVAPLDSKARITEPFVDCYLHVVKDEATNRSRLYSMTAREYEDFAKTFSGNGEKPKGRRSTAK
jgi:uncharacterized protein YPO0396